MDEDIETYWSYVILGAVLFGVDRTIGRWIDDRIVTKWWHWVAGGALIAAVGIIGFTVNKSLVFIAYPGFTAMLSGIMILITDFATDSEPSSRRHLFFWVLLTLGLLLFPFFPKYHR